MHSSPFSCFKFYFQVLFAHFEFHFLKSFFTNCKIVLFLSSLCFSPFFFILQIGPCNFQFCRKVLSSNIQQGRIHTSSSPGVTISQVHKPTWQTINSQLTNYTGESSITQCHITQTHFTHSLSSNRIQNRFPETRWSSCRTSSPNHKP